MSALIKKALIIVGALVVPVCVAAQTPPESPAPTLRSVPAYPAIARAANATGTVNVDVAVAADGSVVSAKSIDGHPLLRQAAELSSQAWRFVPDTTGSTCVVRLIFTFELSRQLDSTDIAATFLSPYHVRVRTGRLIISDPPAVLHRNKRKRSAR